MITSDDILGKEAVDSEGSILGVVIKLHIDDKTVIGITVDQGLMKPDLFIGSDHIKRFGVDAVLLNSVPSETYKGLRVITALGKELGIVKDIRKKREKVISIIVIKTAFSREEMVIPFKSIKTIGESVILKPSYSTDAKT